jgi:ribosomal protein S18 acetylase RimI-like enzyme
MDEVKYETNGALEVDEFIHVLIASGLGERRPVDDLECMRDMVKHANLIVCARLNGKIIGVARSVTDFSYCCYVSDIAVDQAYQNQGIGKELIRRTQATLREGCTLLLLAAPAAVDYYPKIGFRHHDQAWRLGAREELK